MGLPSLEMLAVALLGLAAILVAWWYDRYRAEQRARPPQDPIPGLDPEQPAPTYIPAEQAHRPARGPAHRPGRGPGSPATPGSPGPEDVRRDGTAVGVRVAPGAHPGAGTQGTRGTRGTREGGRRPGGQAGGAADVLYEPSVLVVAGSLDDTRLLAPLWQSGRDPIVVCADAWAAEVVDVLQVNRARGIRTVLPVLGEDRGEEVARLSSATTVPVSDLAADFLPDAAFGRVRAWAVDDDGSHVLTHAPGAPDQSHGHGDEPHGSNG